ncbi:MULTISPECIES: hypothetical protein [unclassified Paenibacillus]|uniref:hypothetical protein n=1 Tax=unclassified Paenibacillus TaxID=185978 RepID=UPI0024068DBB|nr:MULTISPECIES: hypothetical protein [unclassified Paenibacillus]MDF9844810.1 hypothetical protein [Paenibacillus sp. PastF-2]MDF9851389.1 hypothetical protein [Paenibacillus sp. PastM-2]MDF9857994.1 hypothetical protein [Paenibacillus sp. PastF-1]MDH6483262.1 hypothetical protein [Paenibacillus sp. PastH-2]MDH6510672.1 hypothetical protein [Paenibacillus sp. PastM-3]
MKRSLCVLLLFVLTACSPWNQEEDSAGRAVTVVADGAEFPLAVRAAGDGQTDRERHEQQYQALVEQIEPGDIPYIQLGEPIEVHLAEEEDADYELTDVILLPDGSYKYKTPDNRPQTVVISGGSGSFELGINPAAFLSSSASDYEPGATLRGFRLSGMGGGELQNIYFVLRTDAGSVGPSL